MTDCIFCRIVRKELPSQKVYEDEWLVAFHDIQPVAPVHILIVPKEHITSAACIDETNALLFSKAFLAARQIAKQFNLDNGYRVVTNVGDNAGQTVKHLHFHLIGGKKLSLEM